MSRISTRVALLALGLVAPPAVFADGGSRSGESVSVAGPVASELGPDHRQITLDAVYWVDYKGARLIAAIPEIPQGMADPNVVRGVAERDLIADFGLAPGGAPHFLLTTVSLGIFGEGLAALVVFETETKRVGIYRAAPNRNGEGRPVFELLQLTTYATVANGPRPVGRPGDSLVASGPLMLQRSRDKVQLPLDVVYCLDASGREAKLYAAVPEVRVTGKGTEVVGGFAERDLAVDFRLPEGVSPRYLLNTSSLGAPGLGLAALVVTETETKQVAIYRATPKATASGSKASLDLIQVKSYAPAPSTADLGASR